MVCIVLVAGYATRMYPLTFNFPKSLLAIGGKSILTKLVENIDECNKIREFVIVSNHKYVSLFHSWAQDMSCYTNAIITVVDDHTVTDNTRLGAVRDMELGMRNVGDEPVMVIAGDNMVDFSLETLIDYYFDHDTSCVMRYLEESEDRLNRCGVIQVDDNDLIIDMEEKPIAPKSHWVVPPFYIYSPDDAKKVKHALEDGCCSDAPGSFIQWLYKHSPIHAMLMPGRRYDVGSMDGYVKLRDGWEE